eukprot:TRINITY_DN1657_c0_g2_i12.p2 TRINITY_DN1657_c0_g2~~TRINITY_DN1657_c0_g2_i12.p2  ORF type:complete len:180 (+),score=50.46 TRINITY_DN1657_c0_g2_i12:1024-1563(+)
MCATGNSACIISSKNSKICKYANTRCKPILVGPLSFKKQLESLFMKHQLSLDKKDVKNIFTMLVSYGRNTCVRRATEPDMFQKILHQNPLQDPTDREAVVNVLMELVEMTSGGGYGGGGYGGGGPVGFIKMRDVKVDDSDIMRMITMSGDGGISGGNGNGNGDGDGGGSGSGGGTEVRF